jgi:CRISPR/Cas system-associated endonuclease Cas1
MPVKADLRAAQIQTANYPMKKFTVAKALVQANIARSLQVLDWLGQRYDIEREIRLTKLESSRLKGARTVQDLRVVEGRVARRYWEAFGKVLPEHLDLQPRLGSSKWNACLLSEVYQFNHVLAYGGLTLGSVGSFQKCVCVRAPRIPHTPLKFV